MYMYSTCVLVWTVGHNLIFIMIMSLFLQVWIHEGASKLLDDYDLCIKLDRIVTIPTKGYFGISAATGGLSG